MGDEIIYIVLALFALVVIIYMNWKIRRDYLKLKNNIPENVLEDLNEAERRYGDGNTGKTQQEIIAEIARVHFRNAIEDGSGTAIQGARRPDSEGRADVQGYYTQRFDTSEIKPSPNKLQSGEAKARNKSNRFTPI